jgi:hypothetical protein
MGRRQDGAGGGAGVGGAGSLDGVLSTVFGQDGLPITTVSFRSFGGFELVYISSIIALI